MFNFEALQKDKIKAKYSIAYFNAHEFAIRELEAKNFNLCDYKIMTNAAKAKYYKVAQ